VEELITPFALSRKRSHQILIGYTGVKLGISKNIGIFLEGFLVVVKAFSLHVQASNAQRSMEG